MIAMQLIPDIDLILGGSEEKQRAGREYRERNPLALVEWRAHEWMLTNVSQRSIFRGLLKMFASGTLQ
jgi:hypothetical protein